MTVVKEINEPRLPSLKGKMAAKKAEIRKMSAADLGAEERNLGLNGSPTQVKNIFAPESKTDRTMLEGTSEEKIDTLVKELVALKCI